MKKLIAILALMAMGPVAMAQFTVDTSVAGEATVSVPNGVLGLGLDVTVSTGTLDSVEVNGFNVFIDEAWDMLQVPDGALPSELPVGDTGLANVNSQGEAPLSANFAICAGFLAESNPGTAGATIVFKAADGADVILSENVKRGGVVNAAGKVNLNADPEIAELAFTIEAAQQGPTCSDYNLTAVAGGIDTRVDVSDVTALVSYIDANKAGILWRVRSTDAGYNAAYDLNSDLKVDVADVTALVSYIDTNKSGILWRVTCN